MIREQFVKGIEKMVEEMNENNNGYHYRAVVSDWENYGKSRTYFKIIETRDNSKHHVEKNYGYFDNQTDEYIPHTYNHIKPVEATEIASETEVAELKVDEMTGTASEIKRAVAIKNDAMESIENKIEWCKKFNSKAVPMWEMAYNFMKSVFEEEKMKNAKEIIRQKSTIEIVTNKILEMDRVAQNIGIERAYEKMEKMCGK